MADSSWVLQIFRMSDASAQKAVASSLSGINGLNIDARTCERGSYLFIDGGHETQTWIIYALVIMGDPLAQLVHTASGLRARPEWYPGDSMRRAGFDLEDAE